MFSSIQCGVAATGATDVCVLLPGDMPFVQPETIATVIAAARDGAHTATPSLNGHRGHPVVCAKRLRDHIRSVPADARLDHLMRLDDVVEVPVDDAGVRQDIDRPGA
jgi:molybdenum cofactor cytidylyltransferase